MQHRSARRPDLRTRQVRGYLFLGKETSSLFQNTTNLKRPPSKNDGMHCSSGLSQCWVLASHRFDIVSFWTFPGRPRGWQRSSGDCRHSTQLNYTATYCLDHDQMSQLLTDYTITYLTFKHTQTHSAHFTGLIPAQICSHLSHTHTHCPPAPLLPSRVCMCVCEKCAKGLCGCVCVLLISEWWKRDVKLAHCVPCSRTHTLVGSHSSAVTAVIEGTHKPNTHTHFASPTHAALL